METREQATLPTDWLLPQGLLLALLWGPDGGSGIGHLVC